jgi:Resolvase, N terminal domain
VILVWKLDRWGRSLVDVLTTLHARTALRIGFVPLTEALDRTTPRGADLCRLLGRMCGVRAGCDPGADQGRHARCPQTRESVWETTRQKQRCGADAATGAARPASSASGIRPVRVWCWLGSHVADATMPLCTSDPWPAYRHTVLDTSGAWDHPPRQGRRGASPPSQRRPPPSLQYAQVVKRREGGRFGEVSTRVVFGTPEAVATRVADSPVSRTVTTSFVARDTLTPQQSHRRFTRRTNGFSTDLTWCENHLWLSLASDHVVIPHKSWRARFPTPKPTREAGSPRLWRSVTPAMAAGLTEHGWTTKEWLASRGPVEFLDERRTIAPLCPAWHGVYHGN